jgi:CMP-N-acetylneuraminic acid synthetase
MVYKIIIPARANSKRFPEKNMKVLGDKPLIQYSIDFALNHFSADSIWVNSDDQHIIEFAKQKGIRTLLRPDDLATDYTSTVDVLKFQVNYFKEQNIACDAIILLQLTNPFREDDLLKIAIKKFKESKRNSLATFSVSEKKLGKIENNFFKPINYLPGQRSQDLDKSYFENGLLYITKCDSILAGKVITDDVFPLVCYNLESTVDIDYLEDFVFAESLLKLKNEKKQLHNNK